VCQLLSCFVTYPYVPGRKSHSLVPLKMPGEAQIVRRHMHGTYWMLMLPRRLSLVLPPLPQTADLDTPENNQLPKGMDWSVDATWYDPKHPWRPYIPKLHPAKAEPVARWLFITDGWADIVQFDPSSGLYSIFTDFWEIVCYHMNMIARHQSLIIGSSAIMNNTLTRPTSLPDSASRPPTFGSEGGVVDYIRNIQRVVKDWYGCLAYAVLNTYAPWYSWPWLKVASRVSTEEWINEFTSRWGRRGVSFDPRSYPSQPDGSAGVPIQSWIAHQVPVAYPWNLEMEHTSSLKNYHPLAYTQSFDTKTIKAPPISSLAAPSLMADWAATIPTATDRYIIEYYFRYHEYLSIAEGFHYKVYFFDQPRHTYTSVRGRLPSFPKWRLDVNLASKRQGSFTLQPQDSEVDCPTPPPDWTLRPLSQQTKENKGTAQRYHPYNGRFKTTDDVSDDHDQQCGEVEGFAQTLLQSAMNPTSNRLDKAWECCQEGFEEPNFIVSEALPLQPVPVEAVAVSREEMHHVIHDQTKIEEFIRHINVFRDGRVLWPDIISRDELSFDPQFVAACAISVPPGTTVLVMEWVLTMGPLTRSNAILECVRRGAPIHLAFNAVWGMQYALARRISVPSLGSDTPAWVIDPKEQLLEYNPDARCSFLRAWEQKAKEILSRPHAGRFLLMGGLAWRLVLYYHRSDDFEANKPYSGLSSPSDSFVYYHRSFTRGSRETESPSAADDIELALLLGTIKVHANDKPRSLWPPQDVFFEGWQWQGEWTLQAEIWFQSYITRVKNCDFKLMGASAWQKTLRSRKHDRSTYGSSAPKIAAWTRDHIDFRGTILREDGLLKDYDG
jgi:hypothetical protein